MTNRNKLNCYINNLRNKKYFIYCPMCESKLFPKDFENHCRDSHGLNPKRCCVWCLGKKKWERGPKQNHADHLKLCSKTFLALKGPTVAVVCSAATAPIVKNPKLLDMRPLCKPRSFFKHENIGLPSVAFEQFSVLEHGNRVDYFRDENLNEAASYVRLYVETKDSTEWMHVMVRGFVFENFAQIVIEDERTKILPFSCWCGGGRGREKDLYRQHRHLIVVSPKGHFTDHVWNKVNTHDRPYPSFKVKTKQSIKSPLHLVNTLGYVCKRKSRCKFRIDTKKGPLLDKHFFIFKKLPVGYRLPLALQFENGIMRLLYQEKFQNVSTLKLVQSVDFTDGKWTQKVKDFYKFETGWVLPLRKEYVPTDTEGSRFCYLTAGRKLYLSSFPENESLDHETWLDVQTKGYFYDIVGGVRWVPRKRDQEKLNLVMPFVRRNQELEREISSLKIKYEGRDIEN